MVGAALAVGFSPAIAQTHASRFSPNSGLLVPYERILSRTSKSTAGPAPLRTEQKASIEKMVLHGLLTGAAGAGAAWAVSASQSRDLALVSLVTTTVESITLPLGVHFADSHDGPLWGEIGASLGIGLGSLWVAERTDSAVPLFIAPIVQLGATILLEVGS